MSLYHRDNWDDVVLNGVTILKKIGEKIYKSHSTKKNYEYITDILLVKCSCGIEYEIQAKSLVQNKSKCRGCDKRKINIGDKFGKLTIESWYQKKNKSNRSQIWYHCKCDCGNYHDVKSDIIKLGESNSCVICRKTFNKIILGKKTNPKRYFGDVLRNAKKRNLEIKVSLDDVLLLLKEQTNKCHLSGTDISIENGTASLDRTDSNIGYIKDNLQWIYRPINYMKNNIEEKMFLELCHKIVDWQKTKESK